MPGYFAALTILLLLGMVLLRVFWLRRTGTQAMHFGNIDKADYSARILKSPHPP
jgi:hypothetical protein